MLNIAKRIYSGGEMGKVSSSAIHISTVGVAVGVVVMIISLCVTSGFQSEIKDKIGSLIGHAQIVNTQTLYSNKTNPIQISDSLLEIIQSEPNVAKVTRFVMCRGMIKTDNDFRGILLRGVDAGFDTAYISKCLVSGKVPAFGADSVSSDSILLPMRLANLLDLKAGDKVYTYFFDNKLRARRFVIAGIFETNMADFDNQMCYVDSRLAQKLANWNRDQYQGAEIVFHDKDKAMETIYDIASGICYETDAYGHYYSVSSVEELFPQIFSWLTLLDTNVVAILILMISVACVTVVSGLLIIILERTRFIGVMKAMGATNRQLRHLFLYLSGMIVLRGLLWGNILAFALLAIQKLLGILKLDPATYYLDQVPVHFSGYQILVINVATFMMCVLVLTVPTYVISRIHPARSIKFE